ncbi:MAG: beta-propeller fold lactonase family protein [Polyangiaceae bacterium]
MSRLKRRWRGRCAALSAAVAALGLAAACSDSERTSSGATTLQVGELSGPALAYVDQEVCFSLEVSPSDAKRTFFWGDGGDSEGECHSFVAPGHYVVSALVTSAGQSKSETRSRSLLVVHEPLAVAPTSSSTIALEPTGDRLWVVNPDNDSISLLDAETLELLREFPVCKHPRTLALSGAFVAVTCQDSDEVWQLERLVPSDAKRTSLPPGSAPYGVVADPRGHYFYVAEQGRGSVSSIPVGGSGVSQSVATPADPRGLGMLPDGRLFVTHWRGSKDGTQLTEVSSPAAGQLQAPQSLLLPPELGLNSDTNNDGVPSFVNQVVLTPSGSEVWLPSLKANNQTGLFLTAKDLSFDTTARAMLTLLDVPGTLGDLPAERAAGRYAFDDLDLASAVTFSPEGGLAYVAIQGSERVVILDAFSLDTAGSIRDVGKAPQGLALSADGQRLFVHGFMSRSVRAYDVSRLGQGNPSLLAEGTTIESEALSAEVLRGKQIFYAAVDPRMSKSSYLACASCHLDGEGDNLVWDFSGRGEGLRNTIPLRGRAGVASGALHWSGNFDEVQDFEHDIRGPQQGTGFLADSTFNTGTVNTPLGDPKAGLSEDLDALAAYVNSLSGWGTSPFRRDGDAAWEAARAHGKQLFESSETGCRSCHSGEQFSDSGFDPGKLPRLHDVGTLSAGSGSRLGQPLVGIDTPTLRGLWKSAPYLHDGSAVTLREVLTSRNPSDRHGVTSQLSASDLEDLEAYLLTLDDLEP